MVAQAPVWARIGRLRVRFRHRGAAPSVALYRRFPAAGRARPCGFVAASSCLPGFGFGVVAGGVSRGISGRGARGGSVVRFYQRAVLCEVGEDGADGGGFFDAGHDPHRAAAVAARAHVDVDQIAWSDLEQPKGWPEGRRAGCPE